MNVDLAAISCRILLDASALLLWGAFGFIAFLVPVDLATWLAVRLAFLRRALIAIAVLAVVAQLPVRAAQLGSGWTDAASLSIFSAFLTETSAGTAWIAQLVGVLLLLASQLSQLKRRSAATAGGGALLLTTLPLSGHAAMHEGVEAILHPAADILHLLAGGAWVGALIPVAMILRHLDHSSMQASARLALMRFSLAGHFAVALVILTGLGNIALILGTWPNDWSSSYQRLLSLKILLVLTMTGFALINRYALAPRLARPAAGTWLARLTLGEILLGLTVIALVGWFANLSPT